MSFLEIRNLNKSYGKTHVLKDLSLSLAKGKLVGLLGPNGCGKTTLLKVLAGLLRDYDGLIQLDGQDLDFRQNQRIVFQPDHFSYPKNATPNKLLNLYADFYPGFKQDKALSMLQQINLPLDLKAREMSKGMQEKLQIILAVSRQADLYLLDEPIGGVDPASRQLVLSVILDNLEPNSLTLVSTQLISEIEHIFDEVVCLKDGQLMSHFSPDQLRMEQGLSVNDYFIKNYGQMLNQESYYIGQS